MILIPRRWLDSVAEQASLCLHGRTPLKTDILMTWHMLFQQSASGRRKPLASGAINMKDYASAVPTQHTLTIKLNPLTKKIVGAKIKFTLSCVFLREGKAT